MPLGALLQVGRDRERIHVILLLADLDGGDQAVVDPVLHGASGDAVVGGDVSRAEKTLLALLLRERAVNRYEVCGRGIRLAGGGKNVCVERSSVCVC